MGNCAGQKECPLKPSTKGVDVYKLKSEYSVDPQTLRVVVPDSYTVHKQYKVVYLLAVENQQIEYKNSSLFVVLKEGLHNLFNVIFVEVNFEITPWYGDHATDAKVRQESYILDRAVPFIDIKYNTIAAKEGRVLMGYSKSGWGSVSLLFRNPYTFGYALVWDSPFFLDQFVFGMQPIFGTLEQLREYRPDLLVNDSAKEFTQETRIVLLGENYWGDMIPPFSGTSHTKEYHALLSSHNIQHVYVDDIDSPHAWDSRWMIQALHFFADISNDSVLTNTTKMKS